MGGTSGCWRAGWRNLLTLYMIPVEPTSGCWCAGWRNITFMYETGGRDFLAIGVLGGGILRLYIRSVGVMSKQ